MDSIFINFYSSSLYFSCPSFICRYFVYAANAAGIGYFSSVSRGSTNKYYVSFSGSSIVIT